MRLSVQRRVIHSIPPIITVGALVPLRNPPSASLASLTSPRTLPHGCLCGPLTGARAQVLADRCRLQAAHADAECARGSRPVGCTRCVSACVWPGLPSYTRTRKPVVTR
jgi:hypothetical protein